MLKNTTAIIINALLSRKKNTSKRQQHKQMMVQLFGKTRYYLSVWFGQWVLFTGNRRDYSTFDPKPYQKFYKDLKVAERYGRKLQEKYKRVEITKTYDKKGHHIGYMLNGYCKKELPENVIVLKKIRNGGAN